MSALNVEETERAWQELLAETVLDERPPDRLGFTGVQVGEREWAVRFNQDLEARVPRAEATSVLLGDLEAAGLGTVVDPYEVEQELARRAATEVRHGRLPSWDSARAEIDSALRRAVVAVAVGGVYVGQVAEDLGGAAVRLGPDALAVHLDETAEAEIAALARSHGLLGFRFSLDSWWAEDVLAVREDPQIGEELMEDYGEDSWPWLAIASVVPAAGPAAVAGGCAVATALLGALILLDHPPGDPWCGAVPWIAGGLTFAANHRCAGGRGTNMGTHPQRVDAGVRNLDVAESTEAIGRYGAAIDIAAHAAGPAGGLLAAVVASARSDCGAEPAQVGAIGRASQLAWHAAAAEPGAARAHISQALLGQLLEAGSEGGDAGGLADLVAAGGRWRTEAEASWSQDRRWVSDLDLGEHFAALVEAAASPADLLPRGGGWCAVEAAGSNRLLDLAQAAFFGIGAAIAAE